VRILLAGGAGYVGSALAPRLLECGHDVTVVDLLWFGNHLPPRISVIEKDVLELQVADLVGFDQVIFLAGLSNDPMAEFSPRMNFVYNAAAPPFLAYLAKQAGVRRYIHAGSCSVYGYAVDGLYDEEACVAPSYPYGLSKLQGEHGCLQLRDAHFSVISLRKGTVCGYSPRMRLDLVINTMIMTALAQGRIVVNNPAIWRPILAIEDTLAAYLRSVEAGDGVAGIFNIASGNFMIGELAESVRAVLERFLGRSIALEVLHLNDLRNYKVSVDKAVRVLGFEPRHGIESITESLLANLHRFQDFDNPAYYNMKTFQLEFERRLLASEIQV
jgi:nucleoside-diphosphate-sugar epimerase